MQRHDHNATDAPAPAGQYTQAIEVSGNARTLYISGQVGIAADGTVPDDAGMQAKLAWQNLQAQLRAAGMTIENLVKTTTIVPNAADIAAVRSGREAVLGSHKPASTLIVAGLANPAWKVSLWPDGREGHGTHPKLRFRKWERKMPISAVFHYRGGTIDRVMPLAKRQKAGLLKYGVLYRLSRFETGPNAGDWLVVVQYPDRAAYDKTQESFAQDPEYQQVATEIAEFATRISRELVIDLDL